VVHLSSYRRKTGLAQFHSREGEINKEERQQVSTIPAQVDRWSLFVLLTSPTLTWLSVQGRCYGFITSLPPDYHKQRVFRRRKRKLKYLLIKLPQKNNHHHHHHEPLRLRSIITLYVDDVLNLSIFVFVCPDHRDRSDDPRKLIVGDVIFHSCRG
jgi:hypothetical protein